MAFDTDDSEDSATAAIALEGEMAHSIQSVEIERSDTVRGFIGIIRSFEDDNGSAKRDENVFYQRVGRKPIK